MEESVKKKEVTRKYRSNGEMLIGLTLNPTLNLNAALRLRACHALLLIDNDAAPGKRARMDPSRL
jgi:hypothetical protein